MNVTEINSLSTEVSRLGECRIPSPMSRAQFVSDNKHVLFHSNLLEIEAIQAAGEKGAAMILRWSGRGRRLIPLDGCGVKSWRAASLEDTRAGSGSGFGQESVTYSLREGDGLVIRHEDEEIQLSPEAPSAVRPIRGISRRNASRGGSRSARQQE